MTDVDPTVEITHPYAQAARGYRASGWQGTLPIIGKQDGLPAGFTGRHGVWPDDPQVERWIADRGEHNICLRVPADVIGIDVDAYSGRRGLQTIDWLVEQTGIDLPGTWSSSSRDDGSGIRFFRVPPGVNWVSDLGHDSGVEIVRFAHRYAVVWPSMHPDTHERYTWRTPEGRVVDRIPHVEELERLPPEWITALTRGQRPIQPPRDGSPGGTGGASGGGDNTRHGADDVPTVDGDGRAVDVDEILMRGIPVGEQQNELYRYVCSMRGRGLRRSEMIALGMIALQNLDNAPGRDPWTQDDIIRLVDRVRDEFAPGNTGLSGLDPVLRAWAERTTGGQTANTEVSEPLPRDPLMTDLGNSLRVASVLGDQLRYVADAQRWYVWDGRRWEPDKRNRALNLTKKVIDSIRIDSLRAEGDEVDRLQQWAVKSESLDKRIAMLKGAQAEPSLVTVTDEFDNNPDLLVVRNGTLDLRTGELRESRREDHCSQLAEVDYDPDATAERWLGHINFLCDGDPVLAAYIRRAVGYTLTGDVGARSFFFLEGSGSNGKNAFIEPIMQMMGSYAQAASTALLTGGDEQHTTILARLLGARLVFVDETRQGKPLNVERMKSLTGSKRVTARFMRENFFEFDAQFKLWIAGNGQPTIKDPSDGIWNRMHRVVCKGKVSEAQKILRFGDLLYQEEASGILNWALQGLLDWRQLGTLGVPDTVKADVQAYRDDEDYVGQFIDETLERTDVAGDEVDFDAVFAYYREWSEQAGLRGGDVKHRNVFGTALGQHGLDRFKTKRNGLPVRLIRGVRATGVLAYRLGLQGYGQA